MKSDHLLILLLLIGFSHCMIEIQVQKRQTPGRSHENGVLNLLAANSIRENSSSSFLSLLTIDCKINWWREPNLENNNNGGGKYYEKPLSNYFNVQYYGEMYLGS
jgi:hypothetical protein